MRTQTGDIKMSAKNFAIIISTIVLSIGGATAYSRAVGTDPGTMKQQVGEIQSSSFTIKEQLQRIETRQDTKIEAQNVFDIKVIERLAAIETELKNLKERRR